MMHGPAVKVPYYNVTITGKHTYCKNIVGELRLIIPLIIYMKKLLDSDWLRAVQFKCNTSAKSVTSVQKV